jgi:anti-anti-sigma factor
MQMAVEELEGGITSVVLVGRLDIAGAGAIDLQFNTVAGSKRAIVLDLSQVSFLASMGIRTLVSGARTVRSKGGAMVMLSPVNTVENVLRTAGIDELIPIFRDRATAVAAVAS